MKLCKAHWDKLVEAIQADGLGELVPPGPLEFARRRHSRMEGAVTVDNFDPVAIANDLISIWAANGLRPRDLQWLIGSCPICYFDMPQWIEKASHDSGELWQKIRSA